MSRSLSLRSWSPRLGRLIKTGNPAPWSSSRSNNHEPWFKPQDSGQKLIVVNLLSPVQVCIRCKPHMWIVPPKLQELENYVMSKRRNRKNLRWNNCPSYKSGVGSCRGRMLSKHKGETTAKRTTSTPNLRFSCHLLPTVRSCTISSKRDNSLVGWYPDYENSRNFLQRVDQTQETSCLNEAALVCYASISSSLPLRHDAGCGKKKK